MRFLSLILVATNLFGACSQLTTHVWHCPDSGDPATNGANLRTFVDQQSYACGDTIILYAGVEYRSSSGPYYPLRPQPSCMGSRSVFTQFVSSRLAEIPEQAQNLPNYTALMPILSTDSGPIWYVFYKNYAETFFGPSNNYAFRGLLHETTQTAWLNNSVNILGWFPALDYSILDVMRKYVPQDYIVERCLFRGYETAAFGAPTFSNKNGNAFFGSWNQAWSTPATRWTWKNNALLAYGYYRNTAWAAFSGTAGDPTVITGSGLQALLGISYNASCTSGCDYFTSGPPCSTACARVVMRNVGTGSDSWTDMNGPFYVRARADGVSLDVISINQTSLTTNYNSTGYGAFTETGTAELAQAGQQNQEAIVQNVSKDVILLGNYIDSWGNPIFFGGASSVPTYDDRTVLTGSTQTSFIVDNVVGLSVGQVIIVDVTPGSQSIYCLSSGTACAYQPNLGAARITAINGNTLTVVPHGVQGIDRDPLANGTLRHVSFRNEGVVNLHNMLSNGTDQPSADAGKGLSENKQCIRCLHDGNVYGGYINDAGVPTGTVNTVFMTPTNQNGRNPDHTVAFNHWSNNWMFGTDWTGGPYAVIGFDQICAYFISSMQTCSGNVMENNLMAGADVFFSGQALANIRGLISGNIYRHNTWTPQTPTTQPYWWIYHGGCDPYTGLPFETEAGIDVYGIFDLQFKSNIVGYGSGMSITDQATCWPNRSTTVKDNIVVDTNSVGLTQGTLDAIATGNYARANYSGMFPGTCDKDNPFNCQLDPGDPAYGSAPDGSSPGADVPVAYDHVRGWSQSAGLLVPDMGAVRMANNPASFAVGSTRAALTFTLFSSTPSSGCTFKLYTNATRSTLDADTDTGGEQACNRTGNYAQGQRVTFVLGTNSALTAGTKYYYQISDGSRTLVGDFTTLSAGSGTYNTFLQFGSADTLTYSANADLSSGTTLGSATTQTIPASTGSVVYWRKGTAGQRGIIVAR